MIVIVGGLFLFISISYCVCCIYRDFSKSKYGMTLFGVLAAVGIGIGMYACSIVAQEWMAAAFSEAVGGI